MSLFIASTLNSAFCQNCPDSLEIVYDSHESSQAHHPWDTFHVMVSTHWSTHHERMLCYLDFFFVTSITAKRGRGGEIDAFHDMLSECELQTGELFPQHRWRPYGISACMMHFWHGWFQDGDAAVNSRMWHKLECIWHNGYTGLCSVNVVNQRILH